MSPVFASGAVQPQRPGDSSRLGRAALLALIAHGGLIAALSLGLNWRLRTPDAVYAAELWAAVPQLAAPAPATPAPATPPPARPAPSPPVERRAAPTPTPEPRDAQIAIERAERQKRMTLQREAEQQRQQKARDDKARDEAQKEERRKKEAAAQREAQAAEDRLARQREANLARMRGLANATGAATATANDGGSAANSAAPSAGYAGRIKARIKPNIVLLADVSGNPVTEVEVRCASDGAIIGRRIVKSSGNPSWDDTVLRAIDRTDMLPRDVDGRVPATMILVFPRRD